jgi:hypothetical protein
MAFFSKILSSLRFFSCSPSYSADCLLLLLNMKCNSFFLFTFVTLFSLAFSSHHWCLCVYIWVSVGIEKISKEMERKKDNIVWKIVLCVLSFFVFNLTHTFIHMKLNIFERNWIRKGEIKTTPTQRHSESSSNPSESWDSFSNIKSSCLLRVFHFSFYCVTLTYTQNIKKSHKNFPQPENYMPFIAKNKAHLP